MAATGFQPGRSGRQAADGRSLGVAHRDLGAANDGSRGFNGVTYIWGNKDYSRRANPFCFDPSCAAGPQTFTQVLLSCGCVDTWYDGARPCDDPRHPPPTDQRSVVQATGTVRLPLAFVFSAVVSLRSGSAHTVTNCQQFHDNQGRTFRAGIKYDF